jgi:hypothetical protein
MNMLKDLFFTIFNSGPLTAMLFMTVITIFFGYIALTAKVIDNDKK